MNRKILLFLSVVILAFLGVNLSILAEEKISSLNQIELKENETMNLETKIAESNNKFGFNLFKELFQEGKKENIFISPSSISFALSMVYNGANSQTKEEMKKALQLDELNLEAVNEGNYLLRENLLKSDSQIQLNIANSLWLREGFSFEKEFIEINKKYYNSEVKTLNFSENNSLNIINNWVKEKTEEKIPEIIDRIDPNDVMFLINAIYLKGEWTNQFDPNKTKVYPFYITKNEEKNIPLMSNFGEYNYLENELFQGIKLPYSKEKTLSMYIFLPQEDKNLDELITELTTENWEQWLNRFISKEGTIKLPKFKLNYDIELKPILEKIGMEILFDPSQADFSKLSKNYVFISGVKHRTFLEVNEEGSEAAAVTSIGMRATSANMNKPFYMKVDRPFFCVIKDEKTGAILFMGAIFNPE